MSTSGAIGYPCRVSAGTWYEGVTLGYLAGLVAMIIHSIGANTFIIVRIMEPFWFMTGIITLLPQLERKEAPLRAETGSERVLVETRFR